eukprot:1806028-Amphidinium_carterae.1
MQHGMRLGEPVNASPCGSRDYRDTWECESSLVIVGCTLTPWMQTSSSQGRREQRSAVNENSKAMRDGDLNRERLIFCLISCIGRKVTAKLRTNVVYEGVLTSCACNGDFSLTLENARQMSDQGASEVVGTFVIPGKSWMQVHMDD